MARCHQRRLLEHGRPVRRLCRGAAAHCRARRLAPPGRTRRAHGQFLRRRAEGSFDLVATPVRTGGSTQHWTIALEQDGAVAANATALFAARPDTFAASNRTFPDVPDADALSSFAGFPVGWTERYDLRFAEGAPDANGSEPGPSRSLLWIAQRPPRPLDFPALATICDIFFGRIIHVRRTMVPFGTVSMTAYFHATAADLAAIGDTFVLGDADARIFDRGFHDQSAELWSADGRLLATSHQLVYYRDPR